MKRDIIGRNCLVALLALLILGADAKTVYDNPDQYRDREGIVTRFTGIIERDWEDGNYVEKEISFVMTNWFGKASALVSGSTFLSWIYDNQVTYLDGEGGVKSGKNPAGYIWDASSDGRYLYRPVGMNIWDETIYERYAVLDGFTSSNALIRPCDRPSDQVSSLTAVYREFPQWKDKDGNVSFARLEEEEIFKLLPDREDGWDEEEDGIQWKPQIWTTDVPRFKWRITAQFPSYWDKNGELAFYTRSIPYEATLAVWSCSFSASVPEPGKEYYKEL